MTAAPLTDEEAALLNDVGDDDYGLWELNGSISALVPLLTDAIERGHIHVYVGEFGGEMQELPRQAAITCIGNQANWRHREPPENVFSVMTSARGIEALRQWYELKANRGDS